MQILGTSFKLASPLDGDPDRAGLNPPELCAFAYVGPDIQSQGLGHHRCMPVIQTGGSAPRDQNNSNLELESSRLEVSNPGGVVEIRLKPGERRGCWRDHLFDGMKRVAMVDGAVNGRRTGILLDPGTSASVVSLNLARGLKLKLRFSKPFRGAGLGRVPTIVTASAEVKITLDSNVIYILDVLVANVGEGSMRCLERSSCIRLE